MSLAVIYPNSVKYPNIHNPICPHFDVNLLNATQEILACIEEWMFVDSSRPLKDYRQAQLLYLTLCIVGGSLTMKLNPFQHVIKVITRSLPSIERHAFVPHSNVVDRRRAACMFTDRHLKVLRNQLHDDGHFMLYNWFSLHWRY